MSIDVSETRDLVIGTSSTAARLMTVTVTESEEVEANEIMEYDVAYLYDSEMDSEHTMAYFPSDADSADD